MVGLSKVFSGELVMAQILIFGWIQGRVGYSSGQIYETFFICLLIRI